jgi:glycerol-3-phosphate acyltransferase PlsX
MGSIYAQNVLGKQSPRVGLLSNGEEAGKGNTLVKETYPLLDATGLNFVGNVEPKEVVSGEVDVAVMDGFTGNVFVKTSEAVASFMSKMIRDEIMSAPLTKLGGALARPAFRRVGEILDPSETGAAPLLGIDGLVFVAHGRSDARALVNSVRLARQAVERGLMDTLRSAIKAGLSNPK